MIMASFISLYNSIKITEKVIKIQLSSALKGKSNIAIFGTLGLHRTFAYLKPILQSLTPESQVPKEIQSIDQLYQSNSLKSPTKVKYLVVLPDTSQLNLLYSISKTVSPSCTITRLDSSFNKQIKELLKNIKQENNTNPMYPASDIAFTVPKNDECLKTINPEWLILDHLEE